MKYEPVADGFSIDREIFGFVQHETFAFGKAVLAQPFISRCCGCFDGALCFASARFSLNHSPTWKLLLGVQCFRQFQRCSNVTCAPSSVIVATSLSVNRCDDPSEPLAVSPKLKKIESSVVSPASCSLAVAE